MPTVDATWGGNGANSYIEDAAARILVADNVLDADAWTIAATPRQTIALFAATRAIDSQNWEGTKYFWNQRRQFPRARAGYGFGSRAEPDVQFQNLLEKDEYLRQQKERIELAVCFQAVYILLLGGRDDIREEQHRGITSTSRSHRFSESQGYGSPNMVLCPEAHDELRYYIGQRRLIRGDNGMLHRLGG